MYKKIDTYLNKEYVCSSIQYRTCKECKASIQEKGFIEYQGINKVIRIPLKPEDKIQCYFDKSYRR